MTFLLSDARKLALRVFRWSPVFVLITAASFGCAKKSGPPDPELSKVMGPFAAFEDSSSQPAEFKKLFVSGAAPDDTQRLKYRKYSYTTTKMPSVSGDTARLSVIAKDAEGNPHGPVEWELQREGDEWKIKAAPLP